MAVYAWTPHATAEAMRLVRSVFQSRTTPLSTRELYKLVTQQTPQTPVDPPPPQVSVKRAGVVNQVPYPPHPEHPIRSMRYLKQVVLPAMMANHEIEKFHTKVTPTEAEIAQRLAAMSKAQRKARQSSLSSSAVDAWFWRTRSAPPPKPKEPKEEKPYGEEVGVGEDWSHLNKRRQRARERKVGEAVKFMKQVDAVRRSAERRAALAAQPEASSSAPTPLQSSS
ncbi:hypothetical protein GLOTRDRAFT_106859 [Gloeophyllum trabeum ATCC 11539]|uniref:Uncharacterized protein n=1 Tax=Gloeophyllum trabeum (strain ATCC 11539 / FP-39264 / Madison 617) TaxID=670483 RepID=S7Q1L8_GLOTA|nr:uncharacterized protein GLOTRDRAFT_106859 [Gloeophyllum trabeum ATCC 11539]EPQ53871.1 hypothetical protein GLOTRDRAFT_106859 [Gloeophyllum trabeum ATCC 11539]